MRRQLIAGNWKMHRTIPEAESLAGQVARGVERLAPVEVAVFPPFTALQAVAGVLTGTRVGLGAQNMHFERSGAFTGEVSPAMLVGLCRFVILGHSERRHIFGESSETVGRKLRAALDSGLTPVLCVGETLEQRERGETEEVVAGQARAGLTGVTPTEAEGVIIAYEPVWAIGTGSNATPEQANAAIGAIRDLIGETYGKPAAVAMRILYGGSVNPGNWEALVSQEQLDGALVGGASLKAPDFLRLVEISRDVRG